MWYLVRFQLHLLDMIVVIATCFVEINTSFDMMMHHSVDDFVFCFDSCIIDFSFNLSFKPRLYPRRHMKNDFQMFRPYLCWSIWVKLLEAVSRHFYVSLFLWMILSAHRCLTCLLPVPSPLMDEMKLNLHWCLRESHWSFLCHSVRTKCSTLFFYAEKLVRRSMRQRCVSTLVPARLFVPLRNRPRVRPAG